MSDEFTLKMWNERLKEAERLLCENISSTFYGDNAWLDKPYIPPTFWQRIRIRFDTAKERVSNAWAALKGDLDYDR